MATDKVLERIHLNADDVARVEGEIRFHEHLRRYAAIRRFCYGAVLDFACGVGYGTHLLSVNPDVASVTGADIDEEAIAWARAHFEGPKTRFVHADAASFEGAFDTLVSLETIEHIQDTGVLPSLARRVGAQHVILSYPDKKSTHFNSYHVHDFVAQDLVDLFAGYVLYHHFRTVDVQFLLFVSAPEGAPHHVFRNLMDLRS